MIMLINLDRGPVIACFLLWRGAIATTHLSWILPRAQPQTATLSNAIQAVIQLSVRATGAVLEATILISVES